MLPPLEAREQPELGEPGVVCPVTLFGARGSRVKDLPVPGDNVFFSSCAPRV